MCVWKRWAAMSAPAFCLKASRSVVSGVHRTHWQSRGSEYEPLVMTRLSAVSELPGGLVWSVIFYLELRKNSSPCVLFLPLNLTGKCRYSFV